MLVKTSNPSSGELQDKLLDGEPVYRRMGAMCEHWGEELPVHTAIPAWALWWGQPIPPS